jgi:hypothetical protein
VTAPSPLLWAAMHPLLLTVLCLLSAMAGGCVGAFAVAAVAINSENRGARQERFIAEQTRRVARIEPDPTDAEAGC